MATSFISEHSAEYILVPQISSLMAKRFSKVVPIYYWSSREGSSISYACGYQPVSVISVFARRPKITPPYQPHIEVKFNETIFETAAQADSLGIPTFAGVPLASSLQDLTLDAKCAWFELTGNNEDVIYKVSLDGEMISRSSDSAAVDGPLSEEELLSRVTKKYREKDWYQALDNVRELRRGAPERRYWFGVGGYRPFYLLLFE